MRAEELKTIVVIGAGIMGQQIAMNTAIKGRASGYQVILCDSFPAAVEKAQAWADKYLAGRVAKGRLTQEQVDDVKANLTITGDVDGSAAKGDLVIEAIIEKLDVKRELFERISRLCRPDTVLATNSSNIVSSKLADVTEHPERLMNIHYFNPALVMELVELVRGPHTGDEAVELARTFAINTGKSPIVLNKEIAGFGNQPHQRRRGSRGPVSAGEGDCLCGGYRHSLRKRIKLSHGALPPDGSDRY